MTKTFANYPALTEALQFDLAGRIERADFGGKCVSAHLGGSQQSCSAYVLIDVSDEDGEPYVDENGDSEISVRLSDHADRHGSTITIRIDNLVENIEEDGEHIETQISDEDYEACLTEAMAFVSETLATMEIDA